MKWQKHQIFFSDYENNHGFNYDTIEVIMVITVNNNNNNHSNNNNNNNNNI